MAKRKSQSDHDKLVKKIADFFIEKKEPNVKADITGYPSPKEIMWKGNPHGHIPDVTSNNEKQYKYIVEVETDDSINDSHTSDQWKLFSAFAKENSAKFIRNNFV